MLLRLLAGAKENDIPAKRPPRRAGRPAVNMRRTHSKDKGPVRTGIPSQRGPPVSRGSVRGDVFLEIGSCDVHFCQAQNSAAEETNLSGNRRQSERPQILHAAIIRLHRAQEPGPGQDGPEPDVAL